jgi:hypothetical protein
VAVETFNVLHGTYFSSEGLGAEAAKALLESLQPLFQAAWTIEKFLEKGVEVKRVEIKNYRVEAQNPNQNVDYRHWGILYTVEVEASPISPQVVLAIAIGIAAVIVAASIAYTVVTTGPVGGGIFLGLLIAIPLGLWALIQALGGRGGGRRRRRR